MTEQRAPRTHLGWMKRRLAQSLRVKVGALALAFVALLAVFAEVLASPAPIVAVGPTGVALFPGVLHAEEYRALDAAAAADRHRDDRALWPLVRHGPHASSAVGPGAPSSFEHPLGTDGRGRDVFARLVHGARVALGLAVLAIGAALVLGILLGAVAGWVGGFWDEMVARPAELVEAFPAVIVVAVVRAAAPGLAIWSLVLAVAAVRWAEAARLVRGEVVRVGSADFVEAARALGCGPIGIVRRHVLPHALRPLIVSALFAVPSVVLLEVAVSFLGFGTAGSWGVMLADAAHGGVRAPLAAGLALATTMGAAYLLADALGESLDARVAWRAGPRTR